MLDMIIFKKRLCRSSLKPSSFVFVIYKKILLLDVTRPCEADSVCDLSIKISWQYMNLIKV